MIRALFAVTLMLGSLPSMAVDWLDLGVEGAETGKYFLDYDSMKIEQKSTNIKAWTKHSIKPVGELFSLDEYNCIDKKTRTLKVAVKGGVKEDSSFVVDEEKWDYPVPGTTGEAVVERVCAIHESIKEGELKK